MATEYLQHGGNPAMWMQIVMRAPNRWGPGERALCRLLKDGDMNRIHSYETEVKCHECGHRWGDVPECTCCIDALVLVTEPMDVDGYWYVGDIHEGRLLSPNMYGEPITAMGFWRAETR